MDNIEELVESLTRYIEAKNAHDAAYTKYDGYDWGYAGYEYTRKLDTAKAHFKSDITSLIESVIDERLKNDN